MKAQMDIFVLYTNQAKLNSNKMEKSKFIAHVEKMVLYFLLTCIKLKKPLKLEGIDRNTLTWCPVHLSKTGHSEMIIAKHLRMDTFCYRS